MAIYRLGCRAVLADAFRAYADVWLLRWFLDVPWCHRAFWDRLPGMRPVTLSEQ